ncbi:hypothetical protein AMELA_G00218920 [Ameiurus melas]|uniref:CARD domain-containing protein n=1 Tax=Ameiurus melas TaxID=219545 RepID=A0A7J6A5N0_AMEME|nr:hypothetical protein AMELA_G00218920 [Ameiurus melas]
MAEALSKARLHLIERVNETLLKDLIDGLRAANPPVLTGREANGILQGQKVTEDMTGLLVDMVCKKGNAASSIMLSILEQKDVNLAKDLGFILDRPCEHETSRMEINGPNFC